MLLVSACADQPNLGQPGFVEGFAGAAAADEPAAALAGRDLMAAGGSAGDAAAAMFFTLAVTKPASAGLMASGLCLAYDQETDLHQAYRFQAPEGVRALAAIHARFGQLPWRQVLGNAEAMARFGAPVSKAFVEDWREGPAPSGAALAVYGAQPAVGDTIQNVGLASLLGQIRVNGAGAFYNGPAANQLWNAMESAGIPVDHGRWRNAVPQSADSIRVKFGNHDAVFAPFADTPGPAQAAVWPKLEERGVAALPQLMADAGARTAAGSTAETGFVAVDRLGGAVACSLTMGKPFGTGQMVSGMFVSSPGMPSTGPILISNKPTKVIMAVLSGGGAPGWPDAIALKTLEEQAPLASAFSVPRAAPAGGGGFLAEPGAAPVVGASRTVNRLGRVNAVVCLEGLPNYPESCEAAADPRGSGYAAVADAPG